MVRQGVVVARVPTPKEPFASSPNVRRRMQQVRRSGTATEMALRRAVWARGLRYRVGARPLPNLGRTADLVFTRQRVAVFVDGCFWHSCHVHGNRPLVNTWYWDVKLARNVERDRETDRALRDAGWSVVRIWEHENPEDAAERVVEAVKSRRL